MHLTRLSFLLVSTWPICSQVIATFTRDPGCSRGELAGLIEKYGSMDNWKKLSVPSFDGVTALQLRADEPMVVHIPAGSMWPAAATNPSDQQWKVLWNDPKVCKMLGFDGVQRRHLHTKVASRAAFYVQGKNPEATGYMTVGLHDASTKQWYMQAVTLATYPQLPPRLPDEFGVMSGLAIFLFMLATLLLFGVGVHRISNRHLWQQQEDRFSTTPHAHPSRDTPAEPKFSTQPNEANPSFRPYSASGATQEKFRDDSGMRDTADNEFAADSRSSAPMLARRPSVRAETPPRGGAATRSATPPRGPAVPRGGADTRSATPPRGAAASKYSLRPVPSPSAAATSQSAYALGGSTSKYSTRPTSNVRSSTQSARLAIKQSRSLLNASQMNI